MTTGLKIDLSGLEDKWSLHCQENCAECGINFEELDEVPLLLWKNVPMAIEDKIVLTQKDWAELKRKHEQSCLGLALCWKCAQPRIGEMKKK